MLKFLSYVSSSSVGLCLCPYCREWACVSRKPYFLRSLATPGAGCWIRMVGAGGRFLAGVLECGAAVGRMGWGGGSCVFGGVSSEWEVELLSSSDVVEVDVSESDCSVVALAES